MSLPVTFEAGVHYVLHGEGYQVIQILSEGMLVARNLATNAHVAHRITELWQQWQENTLEFARSGPNLRDTAGIPLKTTYTFADLADLPPKLQEITWHRYQLIHPLIHLPSRQRTTQVVEERIQAYLSLLEREKAQGEYTFLFGLRVGRGTSLTQRPSSPAPGSSGRASTDDRPIQAASREALLQSHASPTHPDGDEALDADRPSAHREPLLALTPRTVSRWLRRYLESQQDIRSLVPSYHQRGPRHSHLSPLLEALLQQAIKQTYLTNVRAPVTHVLTSFQELIIAENTRRSPEEQLVCPGKMTVYRYLHQLDAQDVDCARKGRATASREHHQSELGPLPTRPNQRAEFDFARLDLLVVDPADRLPIGRPTLAAIRDKYTGYLLGVLISFDPPSYRVVMECMLYSFLPKTHVKSFFQTQHEYLAFGVPEVLVVDNAIELHQDLELACLQLGIELQHMPVRKPWFKGSIERWFRTLNTDLIHVTPGTTFSHFLERGEYESQKHACITLDRLWELLHLWIVDVYTQEVHSGVGGYPRGKGVPARLWQRALEEQFVPRLPPSRHDLLVLLTRTTKRKVHHYGIEFEHLLYQSAALAPLRSKLARAKHYRTTRSDLAEAKASDLKEGIVHIKYHPGDLSRIWVLDPFSDQYLEVLAVDQQYTQDLSLWKHLVIKRAVHEELKRQVNPEALVLAKARLQQLITDEMRLTRKIRSRQTMARWWNKQVTTWINESPHTVSVSSANGHRDELTKGDQELLTEKEPAGSAGEQALLPSHHPPVITWASSVADLGSPLPSLQEQVSLQSFHIAQEGHTPFEPFPPPPLNNRSPLDKQPRTRRGANEATRHSRQHTAEASAAPQQALLHEQEAQDTPCASHQQSDRSEHPSTRSSEMTATIQERQQSFGIEARSRRWR